MQEENSTKTETTDVSDNLKGLIEIGTEYFQDLLYTPPPKPTIEYGRNWLPIGRRISDGSIFYMDMKEAFRCTFVGSQRSGKTFFIRAIADRLVKIGYRVIQLSDVKDEFKSGIYPVQDKFKPLLLEGEEPKRIKVLALRPTFFRTIAKRLPDKNFWYSVNIKQLSKADFFTLLNVPDMTQTQQISMELVYENMMKRVNSGEKFTIELVEDVIDNIQEIDPRTQTALKFKFRPLRSAHFFDSEYERDLVYLINKGFVPAFNLESFEEFGKSNYAFPEVTLNIALREIVKARRKQRIPKLFIFLDEAIRWIGNDKNSSFKSSVMESIDLDARYGISYGFATQSLLDLPDKVLRQSRYIFIPSTADTETIKNALISTGLVKNVQISRNESIRIKKRMRKFKFSWLVLDRMQQKMDLILPVAPLSRHMETTS